MNQKDIRYYVAQILILAVAVAVGVWQGARQQEEIKEDLLEFAKVTALNISPQMIESLQGSAADLENPQYQHLKTLLAQTTAIETEAKFAYVFGQRPENCFFTPITNPSLRRIIRLRARFTTKRPRGIFWSSATVRRRRLPTATPGGNGYRLKFR